MATRERMCPQCERQFSYVVSIGADRKFCTPECSRAAVIAKRKAVTAGLRCTVPDCTKPPRAAGSALCEMHYARQYRNGSIERVEPWIPPDYEHEQGYILVHAPGHPLAKNGRGRVYEHRMVFFDLHGPGPHRCHWCSRWVRWEKLHVDHKDGARANNRPENLVPSCNGCNTNRTKTLETQGGGYSPMLTLNGVTKRRADWAASIGIKSANLQARIDSGWPLERALTEPRGVFGPRKERQLRLL